MLIPLFSYDRHRLKTNTDISVNTNADTNKVLAENNILMYQKRIKISPNRYINISLGKCSKLKNSKNYGLYLG